MISLLQKRGAEVKFSIFVYEVFMRSRKNNFIFIKINS